MPNTIQTEDTVQQVMEFEKAEAHVFQPATEKELRDQLKPTISPEDVDKLCPRSHAYDQLRQKAEDMRTAFHEHAQGMPNLSALDVARSICQSSIRNQAYRENPFAQEGMARDFADFNQLVMEATPDLSRYALPNFSQLADKAHAICSDSSADLQAVPRIADMAMHQTPWAWAEALAPEQTERIQGLAEAYQKGENISPQASLAFAMYANDEAFSPSDESLGETDDIGDFSAEEILDAAEELSYDENRIEDFEALLRQGEAKMQSCHPFVRKARQMAHESRKLKHCIREGDAKGLVHLISNSYGKALQGRIQNSMGKAENMVSTIRQHKSELYELCEKVGVETHKLLHSRAFRHAEERGR